MAIKLYFGLPGCGKTTTAAHLCYKFSRATNPRSPYENVYTNFEINCPGVTVIDNECIGQYLICNAAVIIDEALLFANSRDYKNFSKQLLKFMTQHRHFDCDCYFFSQRYNGLDLNIRVLTDEVNYIKKPFLVGKWFSFIYRIPYKIIFPDGKSSKFGEIVEGYAKPSLFDNIFCRKLFRPTYYYCFDTKSRYTLPMLPPNYKPLDCPDERLTFVKFIKNIISYIPFQRRDVESDTPSKPCDVDNVESISHINELYYEDITF